VRRPLPAQQALPVSTREALEQFRASPGGLACPWDEPCLAIGRPLTRTPERRQVVLVKACHHVPPSSRAAAHVVLPLAPTTCLIEFVFRRHALHTVAAFVFLRASRGTYERMSTVPRPSRTSLDVLVITRQPTVCR